MKKNKSMRAAGGLMIATMLTTSIVSGTYAKYVTLGTAKDTARVAKFGVEVMAEGSLFGKNYLAATDNTPTDADAGITVKSENSDNLVAPGTKNDTGLSFSITGTPEVDVNVKIEVADTSADIFLKEGTYPDITKTLDTDDFTLVDDYYPIEYTLTKQNGSIVVKGTLDEITDELNANATYHAGEDLTDSLGNFTLTWDWVFEQGYDEADTLLGELAVGEVAGVDASNYNLNANIELIVTVTQVD